MNRMNKIKKSKKKRQEEIEKYFEIKKKIKLDSLKAENYYGRTNNTMGKQNKKNNNFEYLKKPKIINKNYEEIKFQTTIDSKGSNESLKKSKKIKIKTKTNNSTFKNQTTKKSVFSKILCVSIYIIFPFLFKMTLPNKNSNKTYKVYFFGILVSFFYKILLYVGLYYLLVKLQEETKLSDMIISLIFSLHNFSYVIYIVYSPIINNYFFLNTFQDMSLVDLCYSTLLGGVWEYFIPLTFNSNVDIYLFRFSGLLFPQFFFFVFGLIFNNYFPMKANFIFFLGFGFVFLEEYLF